MRPQVIVFDVNETMLDLGALDPHFHRVFGDAGLRRQWFQQFVQNFLLTIVLDTYVEFGTVGRGALDMIANKLDKTVYVNSDARAKYGLVVDVVDNIRSAGVDQIGLLTEKLEEGGPVTATQ